MKVGKITLPQLEKKHCFICLAVVFILYLYATGSWNIQHNFINRLQSVKINETSSSTFSKRKTVMKSPYHNHSEVRNKWSDLEKCYVNRLQHLRRQCSQRQLLLSDIHKLNSVELKQLVNMFLVDDKHHITLKAIPKTGCVSWKSMIVQNYLNNKTLSVDDIRPARWNIISKYSMKLMDRLGKKKILFYLHHYFSILTVRHPLARLESGFRDKILKKKEIANMSVVANTFQKFLDDIIEHDNVSTLDIHWRPVTAHTDPCLIPFNFIAKTETADMDMGYILEKKLSSTFNPVYKHKYVKTDQFTRAEREQDGGKDLPLFSMLEQPEETIQKLMSKYQMDMTLFRYSYKTQHRQVIAICDSYKKYKFCC